MSPEEKLIELMSAIRGVVRVDVQPFNSEQREKANTDGKTITCFLSDEFLPKGSLRGVARGQLLVSNDLISDETMHKQLVDNMVDILKRYHPYWSNA